MSETCNEHTICLFWLLQPIRNFHPGLGAVSLSVNNVFKCNLVQCRQLVVFKLYFKPKSRIYWRKHDDCRVSSVSLSLCLPLSKWSLFLLMSGVSLSMSIRSPVRTLLSIIQPGWEGCWIRARMEGSGRRRKKKAGRSEAGGAHSSTSLKRVAKK